MNHSALDAAREVKEHGRANDLMDRLAGDASFGSVDWAALLDPAKFVGRAPEQVEAFVERVVEPVRARYKNALGQHVELKV